MQIVDKLSNVGNMNLVHFFGGGAVNHVVKPWRKAMICSLFSNHTY